MPGPNAEATTSDFAELRRREKIARAKTLDAYGSAAFLSETDYEAAGLYDPNYGRILCGRSDSGQLIRFGGDGHCLTFGPNGSGKSVSVVVPNALNYPGSLVLVDPKGAIAPMCARRRRELKNKVWLLDPFNEVKGYDLDSCRRSYNPLDFLDTESPLLLDNIRLIASSLIISEEGKARFFSDSARTVLETLILYALATKDREYCTIEYLLELAFSSPDMLAKTLIPAMKASDAFGGLLAQLGNQLEGFTGEAGANIFMTLRRSLNFLQSPLMQAALKPSRVDFSRLKDEKITVFLVLPAMRLDAYGRWLRLMLSIILNSILDPRQPDDPVLFLVDEAAAVQRLEILESGIALFRGYSIKLFLIFQDLSQLQGIYKDAWSTFIANAGVRQFFNVNDLQTAEYVSRFLGNETREIYAQNLQPGQLGGAGSISSIQRPLMMPDEVAKLDRNTEILLFDGLPPVLARKLEYHNKQGHDPEFNGLYDPDPYRKGK